MPFRAACIAIFAVVSSFAQDLKINLGPAPGSVIQRDQNGRAEISLAGTARAAVNKFIEARVVNDKGEPLPGFDWKAFERRGTSWSGSLKDVPQGGPYTVEVRIAASTTSEAIRDVLVGDLWLLAGQSNMEGVGDLIDVEQPDPRIRSFDQTDRWVVAAEPLHQLVNAADRVHWRKRPKMEGQELEQYVASRKKGAGLGLPFAKEMLARTGIPIGLIPCAHGGTSMDQWSPSLKAQGGDSLYGATLRRFLATGGRIRGVLWYQGESDASAEAAGGYQEKFVKLIESFRADFTQPDLPFYYVQIGRHVTAASGVEWNAVQEVQRKMEAMVPKAGMVPAVDLSLDDGIHVGTADLRRLGRRIANQVCHDLHPELEKYQPYRRGPRPVNAKRDGSLVRVLFAEVNGKLVTQGRLAGFSIHGADGKSIPAIYRAQIDPNDGNSVVLHISGKLPEGATLQYGAGRDPYVNLNDELDMGTPAFGPIAIQ